VPDHAQPGGRPGIIRNWQLRLLRLRRAGPLLLAYLSARTIAGSPRRIGRPGWPGDLLGVARTIAATALIGAIIIIAAVALTRFSEARATRVGSPDRPRWQYLLLFAGAACVAVPALTYAIAHGNSNSLADNVCGIAGLWSAGATLWWLSRAARRHPGSAAAGDAAGLHQL
jgi:hypothetical protein